MEERYYVGLKLLQHYFKVPEVIQLVDNSETLKPIAVRKNQQVSLLTEELPKWFTDYLYKHFKPSENVVSIRDLSSMEEVRKRYLQNKDEKDSE